MEFENFDDDKDDFSEERKTPAKNEKLPPPKRKLEITEKKRTKKRKPNQVGGRIGSEESDSEDDDVVGNNEENEILNEDDGFQIVENDDGYDDNGYYDPYSDYNYDQNNREEDDGYTYRNGEYYSKGTFDFGDDEEKQEITFNRPDPFSSIRFPDLGFLNNSFQLITQNMVQSSSSGFVDSMSQSPPENKQPCIFLQTTSNKDEEELIIIEEKEEEKLDLCVGIGTININHMAQKSPNLKGKSTSITDIIVENADWLDLIVLQEVNDADMLSDLEGVTVLCNGPCMRTITVNGSYGTREFYPIITPTGSGWTVEQSGYAHFSGEKNPQTWNSNQIIEWRNRTEQGNVETQILAKLGDIDIVGERDKFFNGLAKANKNEFNSDAIQKKKKSKRYKDLDELDDLFISRFNLKQEQEAKTRPIITYKLKNSDNQRLNVSVIHTSPGGAEFGRKTMYQQIRTFLTWVNRELEKEDAECRNWIILGDFYLTSEADITTNSHHSVSNKKKVWRYRSRKNTYQTKFSSPIQKQKEDELVWNPVEENLGARFKQLVLAMPVSATNWPSEYKKKDVPDKMQIADYMIVSKNLVSCVSGLFDAEGQSGIWPIDPNHIVLRTWMDVTDHCPVGGLFSTKPNDKRIFDLRFKANHKRYPQEMRDFKDLKSLEEINEIRVKEKGVPPLDPEDGFFFPGGFYVEFMYFPETHNLDDIIGRLRVAVGKIDKETWGVIKQAVVDNNDMKDLLDDINYIDSDIFISVEANFPDIWQATKK